jgi:hypothetical protein
LQEEYSRILKSYVETHDETCLFRVSQLSKWSLKEKVGPDDVAETHSPILTGLVKGLSRDQTVEAFQYSVNPSLELVTDYALASQEYLDLQDLEFERLWWASPTDKATQGSTSLQPPTARRGHPSECREEHPSKERRRIGRQDQGRCDVDHPQDLSGR